MSTSNKFPSDAAAVGWGITLGDQLSGYTIVD